MKISPINNNLENSFKSKFIPNKTLALAFNEAKEECSKEFLKSMNKFLTDGEDRTLNLVCEVVDAKGYGKGLKGFKAQILEELNNRTFRFVDKTKFVTDVVELNGTFQQKDAISGGVACALIERFWGRIKDSSIDNMSDIEVQKSIQELKNKIFEV